MEYVYISYFSSTTEAKGLVSKTVKHQMNKIPDSPIWQTSIYLLQVEPKPSDNGAMFLGREEIEKTR